MNEITIIGGGLAGVEAAWQAANAGARVRLFEMRPVRQTPAHRTDKPGRDRLFEFLEVRRTRHCALPADRRIAPSGSLVMAGAAATRVPAGARFVTLQLHQVE